MLRRTMEKAAKVKMEKELTLSINKEKKEKIVKNEMKKKILKWKILIKTQMKWLGKRKKKALYLMN